MGRGKILIIEDDFTIRDFLADFLEDRDFNVDSSPDGEQGWEKFQQGTFDLVLCDMMMPKMIGIEVLRRIRELKPEQRVIMMSGVKEASMMEKARQLGCHLYINKPVSLKELEERITECFPA